MNAGGRQALGVLAAAGAVVALVVCMGLPFVALTSIIGGTTDGTQGCWDDSTLAALAASGTDTEDSTVAALKGTAPNDTAEAIVAFAEAIAADNSHGYSQARRGGDPDYDCSSLVWAAVKAAGISLDAAPTPFTTWTMGSALEAAGFEHFTWSGTKAGTGALKRGDILVNRAEHTEIYQGGGMTVGAHRATGGGSEDGQPGDQNGHEISGGGFCSNPALTDAYRWTGAAPVSVATADALSAVAQGVAGLTEACTASASSVSLDDLCGGSGVDVPAQAVPWVAEMSKQSGMRKAWVAALMFQESAFTPTAYAADSNGGTWGLIQMNRSVWAGVHDASGTPPDGITDGATHAHYGGIYLARRLAGVRKMKQEHPDAAYAKLSDEDALVIAHNAGEGNLRKYPNIPQSTKSYLTLMHRRAGTEEACSASASGTADTTETEGEQ